MLPLQDLHRLVVVAGKAIGPVCEACASPGRSRFPACQVCRHPVRQPRVACERCNDVMHVRCYGDKVMTRKEALPLKSGKLWILCPTCRS